MLSSMSSLSLAPQSRRKLRHPQHIFNVKCAPYVIQPFMIAPVLPGETMKNLSLQARVLTNPLASKLIGWWAEFYFFYVKHRDLHSSDTFVNLMIDTTATLAAHEDYKTATAEAWSGWLSSGTGMDWVKACARVCIETYFRDGDEAYNACTIDSMPAAYVMQDNGWNSVILNSGLTTYDVTIPEQAADAGVLASDVLKGLRQFELLRATGLVDMTYEDYLRTFGVKVTPQEQQQIPELIRYIREWTYPTASVQASSVTAGAADVTSACSWSIQERADKDRYFREPGFVFGMFCCRPKVYFSNQKRPLVSLMNDAYSWLPALLATDSRSSWKKVTDAVTDELGGNATGDWWIDIKDLLLYGDQFTTLTSLTTSNGMALPSTTVGSKYPVQTSVDAMFVGGDATDMVQAEGIARLAILGHQAETSPHGATLMPAM